MADFAIQRGTATIATSATTATITAGIDYTAPSAASKAFIRITNTHLTGASTSNTTYGADTYGVSVQNGDNITTSVTFERSDADATDNALVYWEIIEYVGAGSGDNEFVVREQTEINRIASSDTVTTGEVSGIVADADVAVFITGQRSDQGSNSPRELLHTSIWNAGADTITFECKRANVVAGDISYACVEFTGSNWVVQYSAHAYSSAGATETETINELGATTRAFLHVQQQGGADTVCDTHGVQVWISSTTQVSFLTDAGANITDKHAVVWVIENTQSDGTPMLTEHYSGTDSAGGGHDATVTAVTLATSSVMGECATLNQATASQPRQMAGVRLTGTTTVEVFRASSTADLAFRFSTVAWPTVAAAPSGRIMSSLAHHGGLAGYGGLAGKGGGLAG